MEKTIAYLGLDVHKKSNTAALVRIDKNSLEFEKKISNNPGRVVKFAKELSEQYDLRICYEAGCTGYKLYRKLTANLNCVVIAPSSLPKKKKRKSDRIDAKNLAMFLKSGILKTVNVPNVEIEEDRDLVRFRNSKVKHITQAKQRIKAFLLRKGIEYDHEKTWNNKFYDWLGTMELSSNDRANLNRYLGDLHYATKFVDELDQEIEELSNGDRYKDILKILCGFRGINTTTAMIIATNIVDFRTFPHPKNLTSFVGVTPGFDESGESKRGLNITKEGNMLIRQAFINAAQHYSTAITVGGRLREQRQDLPSDIRGIIDRCDRRCKKQYWKLMHQGKCHNVAKTAVARELIQFVWEAMMTYYDGELKETA